MTAASPKKLVVAINPSASFGASRDVGPAVVQTLRAMGHEVTSLTEPDFESLMTSARAAVKRRPDALVVVGGDGMVHLGTNLVAGTKVPLGIIPSGTGNDLARGLGIPHDDTEAAIRMLDTALQAGPRLIDAGKLRWTDAASGSREERWFAGALSAGFDAKVNERANAMRHPKGPSRYLLAILAELVFMKAATYRLVVDGVPREVRGLLAAVANNVSYGGGLKLTPTAVLDDGLLDLLVVTPVSRAAFLRLFPKAARGEHVGLAPVSLERVRKVTVDAVEPIVGYADGERIASLPIEVEVVPGALQVLAPRP